MGKFIVDITVSVDGYCSGPDDRQTLDETNAGVGAMVIGGGTFESSIQSWGGEPPGGVPVYVLTGDAGRAAYAEQCGFRVAGEGIARAVAAAREAAGPDKDVLMIGGAGAARSALNAGVVDEMEIHVAPVFLGGGARLFDGVDPEANGLRIDRVVASPDATHIRYVVEPRR